MASNRTLLEDLTDDQWAQFMRDGYLVLGRVASDEEVTALNTRLDDLMDGRVQYGDKLLMQLDPSSTASGTGALGADAYSALRVEAAGQSVGFKGASRAYRKIGEAHAGLEVDDVFRGFMTKPVFRRICDRAYGAHAAVSTYRSMVMCKPSGALGGGTTLPWHQDGGEHWALDRDPLVFVWTALTPATRGNGCVQVVRGSHKRGLLSRRGHTLTPDAVRALVDEHPDDVVFLELGAGEAVLCHNWLVHQSSTNTTAEPRRGFSVNYIDARTRVLNPKPALAGELGIPGSDFPLVFASPFA